MNSRVSRKAIVAVLIVCFLSVTMVLVAAPVSKVLHPNLAAAQDFIVKAMGKIDDAQKANEYDLGGHAKKAKALLQQAYDECKLAAEASNAKK